MSSIRLAIEATPPENPPAGSKEIYPGADGRIYTASSAGVVRSLSHDGLGMGKYQHKHSGGSYTNTWIIPNRVTALSMSNVILIGDQDLLAVPWPIQVGMTVSEMAIYVTTAGTAGDVAHLLIYQGVDEDDDGPLRGLDIYPGKLLLNAGSVSISTTGEKKITGLSQPLEEGRLYFGAVLLLTPGGSGTQWRHVPLGGALTLVGTDSAWATAGVTGVLVSGVSAVPDPFPGSPTLYFSATPAIAIRRSA